MHCNIMQSIGNCTLQQFLVYKEDSLNKIMKMEYNVNFTAIFMTNVYIFNCFTC